MRTNASKAGAYQSTPAASKGNAFCWLTWCSGISWSSGSGQVAGQRRRNEVLEEKRAAGIDPLHIPGLGKRSVSLDPKRFAVYSRARTDEGASRAETMRNALRLIGPHTAAQLAVIAGLENSGNVGALLAHDRKKGCVTFKGGQYRWAGVTDA